MFNSESFTLRNMDIKTKMFSRTFDTSSIVNIHLNLTLWTWTLVFIKSKLISLWPWTLTLLNRLAKTQCWIGLRSKCFSTWQTFLSSGKELLVLGLSVGRLVGRSVGPSKKIVQLENDLSEQILENESYSGSWLDSKLIANHPTTTRPPTQPPLTHPSTTGQVCRR